jgi:hypothetical protein
VELLEGLELEGGAVAERDEARRGREARRAERAERRAELGVEVGEGADLWAVEGDCYESD